MKWPNRSLINRERVVKGPSEDHFQGCLVTAGANLSWGAVRPARKKKKLRATDRFTTSGNFS